MQYGYSKGCRGEMTKALRSRATWRWRDLSVGAPADPRRRGGSFSSQERLREGPTRHSYYRNTVVIYFQWLRCSSSNIVFADFFCVGFVCGSWLRLRKIAKNGCIERSGQTRGRRERTAGIHERHCVHRLFYNTESAGLQAECVIGPARRRGGFQTRLYVPTRNGA